jgi:hypothetical protein
MHSREEAAGARSGASASVLKSEKPELGAHIQQTVEILGVHRLQKVWVDWRNGQTATSAVVVRIPEKTLCRTARVLRLGRVLLRTDHRV